MVQLQAGRRAGIRVSDAELNQTIAEIASQNNFTIEEFIDDLDLKKVNHILNSRANQKRTYYSACTKGKGRWPNFNY